MRQLHLAVKRGMLDGELEPVELDLKTLAPVEVISIEIPKAARLVICDGKAIRDRLIRDSYQMSDPVPPGVLLEIAGNVYYTFFDLTTPVVRNEEQKCWLIFPQWQAVRLQSRTGKLSCILEARYGNKQHKAHIEVTLNIK